MQLEQFKQDLLEWMEEHTGEKYTIHEVLKNNDECQIAISRKSSENAVSPNIYINDLYRDMVDGKMSFAAAASIVEVRYAQALEQMPKDALPDYSNYQEMKECIFARLVSLTSNSILLQSAPYKEIASDLAVTYRCLAAKDEHGVASSLITNEQLEIWGIDQKELHEVAMENTPKLFPRKIQNLRDIIIENTPEEMREMLPDELLESELPTYVITNQNGINGATAILYPDTEEAIAEVFNEEVYILPSSIHECILMPKWMADKEEMTELVRNANAMVVSSQDYLSSNVYELQEHELINVTVQEMNNSVDDFSLDDFFQADNDMDIEPEW